MLAQAPLPRRGQFLGPVIIQQSDQLSSQPGNRLATLECRFQELFNVWNRVRQAADGGCSQRLSFLLDKRGYVARVFDALMPIIGSAVTRQSFMPSRMRTVVCDAARVSGRPTISCGIE